MNTILTSLEQDIRYALRQLRRAPAFAAITVATLALGIGAAVAVFSVIDATLLRPLPYAHQERIVSPEARSISGYHQPWSLPSFLDARPQLTTLEALAGYNPYNRVNLEAPSGPVSRPAVKATDSFFTVFGIKPLLGRTFLPGEDQPGRDMVAVLSYEVWQKDFGGQPDVIGKIVHLDGASYTVIGVMPAGFRFPLHTLNAIYTPLHADPMYAHNRGAFWMDSVGLLKPGVTLQQAQANFNQVFANLGRAYPDNDAGRTAIVKPLQASVSEGVHAPLMTLALAVFAVLAIACVNVAGLLLARGVKREREMALRAAVGAARSRIVCQMLTEGLVLSLAGLALGTGLAYLMLATMRTFLVSALDRGVEVHLNLTVLGAALLVSVLTGLFASVIPAVRLARTDPSQALRAGVATGASKVQQRLRSTFVIAQVALSLVLLVVSGILIRNLHGLLSTELNYPADKILTTQITLSPASYAAKDPLVTLYQPLLDRVSTMPGVTAAGLINLLPIQGWGYNSDIHIAGQPPYPPKLDVTAEIRYVTPGYFAAMGIHRISGRMLSPALDPWQNHAGTIVVNQAFQRKFFANGGDPVGARLDDNAKPELKTGIVGIVSDIRQDLREPPLAEMDTLITQFPPKDRVSLLTFMTLVVRSSGDPQQLIAPIRAALHQIDPTIPFQQPETMAQVVSDSLVFERLENWLFGIFGALAILLTVVGLYGLAQHEVELRTREIGIRMALGSSRTRVVGQVVTRIATLMVAGIAVGWALTAASKHVLASVVVLHPAKDLLLFTLLTSSLLLIGILASLLPARRAASIDPIQALRTE